MKHFILIFTLIFSITTSTYAQYGKNEPISVSQLPDKSQELLSVYFKNYTPLTVEKSWYHYKIFLKEGVKIEMEDNGDWSEIESKYNTFLPDAVKELLPKNMTNYISEKFPDYKILSLEKENYGYKIKIKNLDSKIKLKFSDEGEIIEIDY